MQLLLSTILMRPYVFVFLASFLFIRTSARLMRSPKAIGAGDDQGERQH